MIGKSLVLHRILASALLWLGFLGAGSLAFACQAAAATDDCCPQDPSSPCGEQESVRPVSLACCEATPALAQPVAIGAGRSDTDRKHDTDSPDLLPMPAWIAQSALNRPSDFAPRLPGAGHFDGMLTYLRTGRLRL